MSDQPLLIRKELPRFASMDFKFLRELGIQCVQRLAGRIWTDYNVHDPGVTILEQLCYAINDLGFRTDFTIQDLLHARSRKTRHESNDTFFDAADILPTNPVTIDDYRILIIDRIPFVKNAWIQPVRDNMQGIQGLYRVQLQVDEDARKSETLMQKLRADVFALFNEHRNLCEDIESVQILDVEKIVIHADIEIRSEVVAEELLAEILFKLEDYLNPPIRFYSLEELTEQGYSVDEIFDGPVPQRGFIKKSDLLPLRQELYVSKIIELISGIEGVRRVPFFKVEKGDIAIEGDVIQIEANKYPVLDMDTVHAGYKPHTYPIQFFRGQLNYELDLNTSNQLLYSMYARYKKGYELKKLYNEREHPSVLKLEDIPRYFSIQNSFPIVYGLSRFGLPHNERPTKERMAMVAQLRGYLLIFEQFLANYLAQLASVRRLFSLDKTLDRTYFGQVPMDVPFLHTVLTDNIEPDPKRHPQIVEDFRQKMDAALREFDPFVDRRNRFLDHLLARFGEKFNTDFLLKVSSYIGFERDDAEPNPERELINAKIDYLGNYVELSRNRGRGYNYLDPELDPWNVSGLEKRICMLLHIAQSGNESLLRVFNGQLRSQGVQPFEEVIRFISPSVEEGYLNLDDEAAREIDATTQTSSEGTPDSLENLAEGTEQTPPANTNPAQEGADEDDDDGQDIHIPGVEPESRALDTPSEPVDYTKHFVFRAHNRSELLLDLLTSGISPFNFVVLPEAGKKTFGIYYKGNRNYRMFKTHEVESRGDARLAIDRLVKYLHKINKFSEGIHVVEHILLRPQEQDKYGFEFYSDSRDEVLLTHYELGAREALKPVRENLDIEGAKRANYEIRPTENGQFEILLKNANDDYIARHPKLFDNEQDAQTKINNLVELMESFRKGNVSIDTNFAMVDNTRGGKKIPGTFYSMHLSFVMPNFPTRFQNTDFRTLLRNTVVTNSPAHLHVDFYYLDVDSMEAFEKTYFEWMYERISPEPVQPNLDDKALALVELIQAFKAATTKKKK